MIDFARRFLKEKKAIYTTRRKLLIGHSSLIMPNRIRHFENSTYLMFSVF